MSSQYEKKSEDELEILVTNTLKNKVALLVEDETISMFFLLELFESKCQEIFTATDGFSAIEMVKNHPEIELIFMDIKMPKMDGFEAVKKIREFNNEVVIIAQTAYAFVTDREMAFEVGCNGYISKPIIAKELYSVILQLFNS